MIIDRITYLPNLKSNAWIQTDDLPAKYYDSEDDEPRLRQVYIPDRLPYQASQHNEKIDVETQTDSSVDDTIEDSECGTSSNQDKYDTEYSLEMWEYYRHDSVVYQNPLMKQDDDKSEIKQVLTPFEMEIVTFCRSFEPNLNQYLLTGDGVSI